MLLLALLLLLGSAVVNIASGPIVCVHAVTGLFCFLTFMLLHVFLPLSAVFDIPDVPCVSTIGGVLPVFDISAVAGVPSVFSTHARQV
jgi:hypothetical protein